MQNIRNNNITSPLRYPGSKKRLANYIEQTMKLNGLATPLFVEPFTGGASVSLYLLQNDLVDSVGLIEKDPLVASFWQIVFSQDDNDINWLLEQIRSIEINLQMWDEFKGSVPETKRERALACLFLNRTSFSGILAPSSGPIGGRSQSSDYKIDCRFPRNKLVKRVKQAAKLRDKVKFVWNLHWKNGLGRINKMQKVGKIKTNILYYFDPPFFKKADRLYTFFFTDEDHEDLRDTILKLGDHWILSYDYCEEVKALYGDDELTRVELLYSASQNGGSRSVQEVILSNMEKLPLETKLWKSTEERKNGQEKQV